METAWHTAASARAAARARDLVDRGLAYGRGTEAASAVDLGLLIGGAKALLAEMRD